MSSFGGIGSHKKNDKLRAAAGIHVKIGEIQRYCELMIEVGEVGQDNEFLRSKIHFVCV